MCSACTYSQVYQLALDGGLQALAPILRCDDDRVVLAALTGLHQMIDAVGVDRSACYDCHGWYELFIQVDSALVASRVPDCTTSCALTMECVASQGEIVHADGSDNVVLDTLIEGSSGQ